MGLYWPQVLSVKGYGCRDMDAESLTRTLAATHCRTDLLLTPKLHRILTYPNILDCGPSWCCFYNFCGFWHFQLRSLQCFLCFCQVCILQRGHDHINVPLPVKGYDVRSTSCLNNNAGPQTLQSPLSFNCRVCAVVLRQWIFQQWCEDECAYARWRARMSFNACCLNHNADLFSSIIF